MVTFTMGHMFEFRLGLTSQDGSIKFDPAQVREEVGNFFKESGCNIHDGDGRDAGVREKTLLVEVCGITQPFAEEFVDWIIQKYNQEAVLMRKTEPFVLCKAAG